MRQTKATADFYKYAAALPPQKKKKSFFSSPIGKGLLGGGLAVGALGAGMAALHFAKGSKNPSNSAAAGAGAGAPGANEGMIYLPEDPLNTASRLNSVANYAGGMGVLVSGVEAGSAIYRGMLGAKSGRGVAEGIVLGNQILPKMTSFAAHPGALGATKVVGKNAAKGLLHAVGPVFGSLWGYQNADAAIDFYGNKLFGGAPSKDSLLHKALKTGIVVANAAAGLTPVGAGGQILSDAGMGVQEYYALKDQAQQMKDISDIEGRTGGIIAKQLKDGNMPSQTARLLINPDGTPTTMGLKYLRYLPKD